MPSRLKLAMVGALKAKRAWDRLPPEHRRRLVDQAAVTLKSRGPVVAKKVAETARAQAPVVARRLAETIERARKR